MYRVIIPNLDRRPDRWRWCLETLLEQGTPKDSIERFSAFDGTEWSSIEEAHAKMERLHGGKLPRYLLSRDRLLTNYAWRCTWYTILLKVAKGNDTALVMIDDWSAPFDFETICRHIQILNDQPYPLLMVQYNWHKGTHESSSRRSKLERAPELEIGLRGAGDSAVLFTPPGAQRMIEFTNADKWDGDGIVIYARKGKYRPIREFRCQLPEYVTFAYALVGDPRGCYSSPDAKLFPRSRPDYVSHHQDRDMRVMLAHRKRRDWILGDVPLPRALDSDEKYKLGFRTVREGRLELIEFVEPEKIFRDYSYRSSRLSDEHIFYRMDYAKRIFGALNDRAPRSICEIACNDGYMLNRYVQEDMKAVGVEPAVNLHQYIDDRVKVYGELFDNSTGGRIFAEHGTFDIIHAHDVIAHCPDPISMLKGMMKLMHEKSVLILEFKYLVDMLKQTQFYHIHHGHYYYFSVSGLRDLMTVNSRTRNLKMLTAEQVSSRGGNILCALGKNGEYVNNDILWSIFESEREYLNKPDIFEKFMSETERQLKVFAAYVNSHNSRSVQGLFANAKAVIILNLALSRGLELDRFSYFYDDAPELQGRCLPGTSLEIRPLSRMDRSSESTTILFAPNLTNLASEELPGIEIANIEEIMENRS